MKVGKEIALILKKSGKKICDEWYSRMMKITTFKELVIMYFAGDDWSMEMDFPDEITARKYKGGIEPYGIKVDSKDDFVNDKRIAFFGNSESSISYDGYQVGTVIIRHQSKVHIKASGNSIVFVNILDNATLQIDCTDEAQVTVYDYGKNTKISANGNVKQYEKAFK